MAVKGDKKGAIALVEKSPAPWERSWREDGVTYKEWNYLEDKKGNEITDPSQLSISFAKSARRIFADFAFAAPLSFPAVLRIYSK